MLWKLRAIEICKLIENNRNVTRALTKSGLMSIQKPHCVSEGSHCVSSHTMNYLRWCPAKLFLLEKVNDHIVEFILPVSRVFYSVGVLLWGKPSLSRYQHIKSVLNWGLSFFRCLQPDKILHKPSTSGNDCEQIHSCTNIRTHIHLKNIIQHPSLEW